VHAGPGEIKVWQAMRFSSGPGQPQPDDCDNRRMSDDHDRWLAGRWERLREGPGVEAFALPPDIQVVDRPTGLVLRGPPAAIGALRPELEKLARSGEGASVIVGEWTLRVAEVPDPSHGDHEVVMPWHGWAMAGAILSDAAYGYEPNPINFSEVGYLVTIDSTGEKHPAPRPDIGVEVIGGLWAEDTAGRA